MLALGDEVTSQGRTITESIATTAAWLGGYVHPLFMDHDHVREHTSFTPPVLPGQFVLYLLGGLAEMTGTFDDTTIGLVGLDEVRFRRAVTVGDTIHLRMEVLDKQPSDSGRRGSITFAWRCVDQEERTVLEASVTMLFAREKVRGTRGKGRAPDALTAADHREVSG